MVRTHSQKLFDNLSLLGATHFVPTRSVCFQQCAVSKDANFKRSFHKPSMHVAALLPTSLKYHQSITNGCFPFTRVRREGQLPIPPSSSYARAWPAEPGRLTPRVIAIVQNVVAARPMNTVRSFMFISSL
jgi:hypothetical protein